MNKLTAEKCREQFEEWVKSFGGEPDLTRANAGANYSDESVDIAWISWKASRNALEIEIPAPACRYADDSYKAYTRKQVENILSELGVKIVEEDV